MKSRYLRVIIAAVLCSTAFCDEDQNKPHEFDTIVIGMGASGTVAASTLARAGKKVLALEAQDRIGGRVYSVPFDDGFVEVGAEWIHGTEGSITYQTAIENNITIISQDLKYHIIRSDGSLAEGTINDLLEKGFEFAEDSVRETEGPNKVEPLGTATTKKFMEYLRETSPEIFEDKNLVADMLLYLKRLVEAYECAYDWNDINADTTSVSLEGKQDASWHRNGYKTFFDLMLNTYKDRKGLSSLQIELKTEVTKIKWPQETDGKVEVTTKDGKVYKAENVIVTPSIGVLKNRYKTLFSPSLPEEKVRAIEKLQIGLLGKIIFSFPNAWWQIKHHLYGFLWNSEDIKKVETMPEDLLKTKSMEIIRRFMGTNITIPEPNSMLRTKWFANEYTRGTYTYDSVVAADVPTARADLAAPLKDSAGKPRVLFAGEASHTTYFGTVHGAAETGRREAMRLLGTQNA